MTRVVEIRELEGCLDSVKAFEVILDEPLAEPLMRRLARGGTLDFHPEFPRPYFRISQPRAWVAQGVLGNCSLRITGSPSCPGDPAQHFRGQLEEGEPTDGSEAKAVLRDR